MAATLSPDRILRELTELWVSLGRDGQAEAGAGVLRACTMTLVVLAEESEDVSALGETLAALMPEHPARTILIRLRGAGEPILTDRVYAQCWMPFGQRRQICCEQIEITASDSALGDMASVLLPLGAPDLPLILWGRSARRPEIPECRPIAAMARKTVLDSAAFPDPRPALRRMAEAVRQGALRGDLAWTRLTRWREMLAQVFENRQALAHLAEVTWVRVTFGPPNEVLAWYMGAWVVNALSDAGVHPSLAVAPQPGVVLRVELAGEGFRVELVRESDRLVVTVNDLANCTNLSHPTDYLLMREELGIVRRDPVFERTLASAATLAYPTDK